MPLNKQTACMNPELEPLTQPRVRATDPAWVAWTSGLAEHPQLRFWAALTDDLLLVVDGAGRIGYASGEAERWLGMAPEAVVGTRLNEHVHPIDQHRLPDNIVALAPDRSLETLGPLRFENPSGETVWLAGRAIDLTGDPGVGGLLLRFRDAATDPRVLDRIRESADRFYKVFRTSPASIAITSLEERRFTHVNDGFLRLLEYQREEVIGHTAHELAIDVEEQDRDSIYERVRREGSVENIEAQVRTKGGAVKDIFGSYFLLLVDDVPYVVHKVIDITTIRALEREVLQTSERERRHLAHNLHDNVGQLLTATSLRARMLEQRLARRKAEEAGQADQLVALLERALEALRGLSRQMQPLQLEEGGLRAALSEFARHANEAYDVTCTLRADEAVELDDPDAVTHLYRIVQEALTNAVRHGRARRVEVEVAQTEEALTLHVRDDGGGFPESVLEEGSEGVGLRSMRYRARVLGASLRLANGKRGGARVEITLPLQRL